MILRMSLAAAAFVLVTWAAWLFWRRRKPGIGPCILAGLVFGACTVLANHLSIDYGNMLLNVRDIGPLAAGLFFDPLSGIIAGIIGGAERFAASELWGMGVFTRDACSVSTLLAGILPALLYRFHRGKRPPVLFCLFLGAVMEVFHMYAVFFTHRNDLSSAYDVVSVVALPMIVFTALGVAACSLAVRFASGEGAGPNRTAARTRSLSNRFQFWLMLGTVLVFLINFAISFSLQTQSSLQLANYMLNDWTGNLSAAFHSSWAYSEKMFDYVRRETVSDLHVIALGINGVRNSAPGRPIPSSGLDPVRNATQDLGLYLLSPSGKVEVSSGEPFPNLSAYSPLPGSPSFGQVLAGYAEETLLQDRDSDRVLVIVPCQGGFLCSLSEMYIRTDSLSFAEENDPLADIPLPPEAHWLVLYDEGGDSFLPMYGTLLDRAEKEITPEALAFLRSHKDGDDFPSGGLFLPGRCLYRSMPNDNFYSLVIYGNEDLFADRDVSALENLFSDLLIFVVLYLIVSGLVEWIVANPMSSVNASLRKITEGRLDTVVSVRSSTEYEALSDDINATVDTLKGYISAAEKRMEKDLLLSKTIQASVLPKNFFPGRTDFDLYASMKPAKQVGGDFYDFFFTGDSHLMLVIADVSGKSIPGALFMMRARSAIRSAAESGIRSPAEIFARANQDLCEGNDADMFVTAWIGVINLKTGVMKCANAGHEYPIISRKGCPYELFKDSHSVPLAIRPKTAFKEYSLVLSPGDRLFVYTDGIPEAVNVDDQDYGTARLLEALNRNREESSQQAAEAVREDLGAFVGDAEPFDDVTMLVFAYNGPRADA